MPFVQTWKAVGCILLKLDYCCYLVQENFQKNKMKKKR